MPNSTTHRLIAWNKPSPFTPVFLCARPAPPRLEYGVTVAASQNPLMGEGRWLWAGDERRCWAWPSKRCAIFSARLKSRRSTAPAGEALGLPGRAYGEDFYRLEQRELFPRLWCVAGFSSDIPESGDMMPVELAGWPLVLVRGEDGEVRAFHNICRHRAMRVVPAPCRGHSALVCPWHS